VSCTPTAARIAAESSPLRSSKSSFHIATDGDVLEERVEKKTNGDVLEKVEKCGKEAGRIRNGIQKNE
jgi:hypothetical protein